MGEYTVGGAVSTAVGDGSTLGGGTNLGGGTTLGSGTNLGGGDAVGGNGVVGLLAGGVIAVAVVQLLNRSRSLEMADSCLC